MDYTLIINLVIMVSIIAVLIAIALFIHDILKKEHELAEIEKSTLLDYHQVLDKAHTQAKSLLYQTTVEAGNILTGAKKTNEKIEEDLDRVLQNVAEKDIHQIKSATEDYKKDYKEHLNNFREEMHNNTQEAIQATSQKYNEQLEKFTADLLKNGITTQADVDNKKAELLSKAEAEIEVYKNEKIAKIDEETKKIIEKVYKDVLRVGIPPNLHQELIMKSLEQAKKDGIFKI